MTDADIPQQGLYSSKSNVSRLNCLRIDKIILSNTSKSWINLSAKSYISMQPELEMPPSHLTGG